MTICQDCWEKQQAWLDYRPPKPLKIAQSGNPQYNVPWGQIVTETIKSQLAVIETVCERTHQQEGAQTA